MNMFVCIYTVNIYVCTHCSILRCQKAADIERNSNNAAQTLHMKERIAIKYVVVCVWSAVR